MAGFPTANVNLLMLNQSRQTLYFENGFGSNARLNRCGRVYLIGGFKAGRRYHIRHNETTLTVKTANI